jgi:3-deoxy-D-manno-octulosonic-acid transferase
MSIAETLYETAIHAARPVLAAAGMFSPAVANALRARATALAAFERYGAETHAAAGPLVWLHAPSVGEALMAQAIIAELRVLRADVRVAFTFFSPSAERMADRVGADVSGYLPFDTTRPVRRALRALQPQVLAFVRTEVWPVLVREAARTGCRTAIVNGVLSAGSGRLGGLAGFVLRPAHRRLDAVGIVTARDAERFETMGVQPARLRVTGDARFDQVWTRVHATRELPLLRALHTQAPIVVAGSTWPQDEARLTRAIAEVSRQHKVHLIIAPHQPTARHVEALERRLDARQLEHARIGALAGRAGLPPIIVVDRVGILADLYRVAAVAYVGGGFGTHGLHSVIEPAALGVPVVFGPRHGNAAEADALAAEGGGFVVDDAAALAIRLHALLSDTEVRVASGSAARAFVAARRGGARRNAQLVAGLLAARTSQRVDATAGKD